MKSPNQMMTRASDFHFSLLMTIMIEPNTTCWLHFPVLNTVVESNNCHIWLAKSSWFSAVRRACRRRHRGRGAAHRPGGGSMFIKAIHLRKNYNSNKNIYNKAGLNRPQIREQIVLRHISNMKIQSWAILGSLGYREKKSKLP